MAQPAARVVGVGLPRTGTRYLSGLLTGPRRAAHDFDLVRQAFVARAYLAGTGNAHSVRHYLLWREQAMRADADICGLNQHTTSFWPEVTPDAVFVLTIRDPLEWVDALARALTTLIPRWPIFTELREVRCRPDLWPHLAGDAKLSSLGLFSLDAYLHWWASATQSALRELPSQRLLVIPTADLPRGSERIAEATGWLLSPESTGVAYRNAAQPWSTGRSLIDDLPAAHVAAAVGRHLTGIDWSRLPGVTSEQTWAMLGRC